MYKALAIAIKELEPAHKPNLFNTEPVITIGPHASWFEPGKIVSIDPWGHIVTDVFGNYLKKGTLFQI